ncbi:hypothetical protein [Tsuneonella sp. HG222]
MEQTRNKAQAPACPLCWLEEKTGALEVVADTLGRKAVSCTRCRWTAWQDETPEPGASGLADDLDCCPTVGEPPARIVPEHLCHRIGQVLRTEAADAQGWFTPPRLDR